MGTPALQPTTKFWTPFSSVESNCFQREGVMRKLPFPAQPWPFPLLFPHCHHPCELLWKGFSGYTEFTSNLSCRTEHCGAVFPLTGDLTVPLGHLPSNSLKIKPFSAQPFSFKGSLPRPGKMVGISILASFLLGLELLSFRTFGFKRISKSNDK